MITDGSGNQIFSPCGVYCVGFGDICPTDEDGLVSTDDWLVQSPKKNITSIELKFSE